MRDGAAGPRREQSVIGDTAEDRGDRRWRLIGDVALFQGKLLLDGVRDLILSPVSLAAALLGLATSREDPGRHFYRLMGWGRWSDRAINLFRAKGAPDNEEPGPGDGTFNVDQLADEVERLLIERYARSALARAAKGSIDRNLDRVHSIPAVDRERLHRAAQRIARGLERTGLINNRSAESRNESLSGGGTGPRGNPE